MILIDEEALIYEFRPNCVKHWEKNKDLYCLLFMLVLMFIMMLIIFYSVFYEILTLD